MRLLLLLLSACTCAPEPSVWAATTVPYGTPCTAGCPSLTRIESHGVSIEVVYNPAVDDPVAQWGHATHWTDTAVSFRLPEGWFSLGDVQVDLARADGTRSVGRTLLRVEPPAPRLTALSVRRGTRVLATLAGQTETIDVGDLAVELRFDQPIARDMVVRLIPATRAAPASGPAARLAPRG